jgi:molybdenum cofactor biosynthesis enzyme MoaA
MLKSLLHNGLSFVNISLQTLSKELFPERMDIKFWSHPVQQVVELSQALLKQGNSVDQIMEVLMPV